MSEKTTPTVDQLEQVFKESPKVIQLLTEHQRYKQQARLRALDLAFHNSAERLINDPLMNQQRLPQNSDYLAKAEKYYNWLIDILPDQLF